MKIIIPVVGFGKAGGHRVLSRLATELVNIGHDVYFVVPESGHEPYYPTSANIIRTKKKSGCIKLWNIFCDYYHIWRKIKEINADVVIANHHLTAYIVALLPTRFEKFYYVQAYEVVFGHNVFAKIIAFLTYLLPLKKIVNSETILPSKINNFVGVVPAGVDIDVFYSRITQQYTPKNIGLVGRKERHKGTKEILTSILKWKRRKDIVLNIAVYLSDEHRRLLDEQCITYKYYEIGNDNQLADFYRANDLIIATGLVEDGAFHYPCAEAMACGCMVISNYAPLVCTQSIFKIPKFDFTILEEKLNLFYELSDDERELELRINSRIIANYSWDSISKKFNSILTKP